MTPEIFLKKMQEDVSTFAKAVATKEGEWIIKGFIDINKNIYTISVDTKIISKVLELLLFPMFTKFAEKNNMDIELASQQNFYPDVTFIHRESKTKFAVDIKSTYRKNNEEVNGMTLGAFTGYFRDRKSSKNTLYPYEEYLGHFVLGVIYTQCNDVADERNQFTLDELDEIPSVIKDFQFFVQPKYKIASWRPGSGNTKNIGSVTKINELISGSGPFAKLGEEVYDDYWMYYLTNDMARTAETTRPYTNLKTYIDYKQRGGAKLKEYKNQILQLSEEQSKNQEDN